jgi:hypothetical protein
LGRKILKKRKKKKLIEDESFEISEQFAHSLAELKHDKSRYDYLARSSKDT